MNFLVRMVHSAMTEKGGCRCKRGRKKKGPHSSLSLRFNRELGLFAF